VKHAILVSVALFGLNIVAENFNDERPPAVVRNHEDFSARCVAHHSLKEKKVDGWKCSEVRSGGPFDQAGVKDGDIITAVDDLPLATTGEAMKVLNRIEYKKAHSLHVLRDGHETVLSLIK
jgi:type II secretory pathway component PulC